MDRVLILTVSIDTPQYTDYDGVRIPKKTQILTFQRLNYDVYYLKEDGDQYWKFAGHKLDGDKYKAMFPTVIENLIEKVYTDDQIESLLSDPRKKCRIIDKKEFIANIILDAL